MLSLRSLPAHVVQQLGAVQAESKPLSRTSWEFWCLHQSTTHCVGTRQMQPWGWVLFSVIMAAWKKLGVSVITNRTKVAFA